MLLTAAAFPATHCSIPPTVAAGCVHLVCVAQLVKGMLAAGAPIQCIGVQAHLQSKLSDPQTLWSRWVGCGRQTHQWMG